MNGHWSPENTIFVYKICNCMYTLNSHMLSKSFEKMYILAKVYSHHVQEGESSMNYSSTTKSRTS